MCHGYICWYLVLSLTLIKLLANTITLIYLYIKQGKLINDILADYVLEQMQWIGLLELSFLLQHLVPLVIATATRTR